MKNYRTLLSSALVALTVLAGVPARAADNMASIGITPATGVATLAPHWSIGPNLGGFHQMSQDLGLGGQANDFYSLKNTTIPLGGDTSAFTLYVPASGFATNHIDIGSKLRPDSYSALTSADPDVGYGPVNMYFIHHKGTTDYFTVLVPGTSVSSSVTDLKPMSAPGGPSTVTGVSGYFGLTFAASNLGYGLNQFYYLRTDSVTGLTKFGTLDPALLNTSADQFSLGISGHKALAYTGVDVGYGVNKMYYLRLDPITGFTILGMLDPALAGVRHTSDIANLGSVFTTLTFTGSDIGFGVNQFYTTGTVNPTWQSVSFAAIADRAISAGSFTVNPTASSALPIVLTVASGSTGSATISSPVGGVFTITPTAPGLIILQASQAGAINPIPYEANMLRQSFTATGTALTSPWDLVGAADFNSDGQPDLIWQNTVTGQRAIWIMNGSTPVSSATIGTISTDWSLVGAADFNSDGKPDLIWQNTVTGQRAIWIMNGTTPVSSAMIGTISTDWDLVGAADFNSDGKPDLIWQNKVTGQRAIWIMNGTTPVSSANLITISTDWSLVGAADFNSDGKPDLIWQNTVTGQRAIWIMNGTTPVSSANLITIPTGWDLVGAADFSADSKPDLLWQNKVTGQRAIWIMNGTTPVSSVTFATF